MLAFYHLYCLVFNQFVLWTGNYKKIRVSTYYTLKNFHFRVLSFFSHVSSFISNSPVGELFKHNASVCTICRLSVHNHLRILWCFERFVQVLVSVQNRMFLWIQFWSLILYFICNFYIIIFQIYSYLSLTD